MIDMGVASPSAQGQAMINTATAAVTAAELPAPAPSQNPNVAAAMAMEAHLEKLEEEERLPEALALYDRLGWEPIAPFTVAETVFTGAHGEAAMMSTVGTSSLAPRSVSLARSHSWACIRSIRVRCA